MSATRPITEEDLHAYIDRNLDPGRLGEVEDYLARFPDVARRIRGYAGQRETLRRIFDPIACEPVPPELSLARLIENRRRPRIFPWRSIAAAIVLTGLSGTGGWSLRGMAEPPHAGIAALAQEAADSYEVYGPDRIRPVEIRAAESAELTGWVSQRLKRPIAVPDLAPSGYRFMGGRLVATPHGPAGLFMYDDDRGSRLVMLVRPMAAEQNTPMSQQSRGPVQGFAWADQGIGYSLVGAVSPEVLHPLADEIRRQVDKET